MVLKFVSHFNSFLQTPTLIRISQTRINVKCGLLRMVCVPLVISKRWRVPKLQSIVYHTSKRQSFSSSCKPERTTKCGSLSLVYSPKHKKTRVAVKFFGHFCFTPTDINSFPHLIKPNRQWGAECEVEPGHEKVNGPSFSVAFVSHLKHQPFSSSHKSASWSRVWYVFLWA